MVFPSLHLLTWTEFLLLSLIVTLLFELVTVILRFVFELRAETSLAFIGLWTGGIRVHHLYVGALLCAAAFLIELSPRWNNGLLVTGIALILSDVAHHFLVLWPLTGSHEFHLKYPPS